LRLALTGDPAGIGPVILKALADSSNSKLRYHCDWSQLNEAYTQLVQKTHCHAAGELAPLADPDELSILDVKLDWEAARQITTGTGMLLAALLTCLLEQRSHTLAGEFQGIVTGPIAKSAWKASGYNYQGKPSY